MEVIEKEEVRNNREEEAGEAKGPVLSFSGWILVVTKKKILKRRKLKGANDPQGLTCVCPYSINSTNK